MYLCLMKVFMFADILMSYSPSGQAFTFLCYFGAGKGPSMLTWCLLLHWYSAANVYWGGGLALEGMMAGDVPWS